MKRDIVGEIIFWATLVFASALYFISAPAGLPWTSTTELALAYAGKVVPLPEMAHPVWGYLIQIFDGHFVALSAVSAALAGGLIGALVNRYFGWRLGVALALAWVMSPAVWNRAITGAHGAFSAFCVVLAVWLANAGILFFTRRARKRVSEQGMENAKATLSSSSGTTFRARLNRIAAWALLGASGVFAIVSASMHDYSVGEAASAYARVTLDEAGDRLVLLGGLADDQMVWETEKREPGSSGRLLSFRNDAAYRTQLVARVRREWPGETNLWVAAQIGTGAFADLVMRKYPERVYVMTGASTTVEKWSKRWEAMKPYLGSKDSFLPVMRRTFAYEGNAVGNRLQEEGRLKEAWEVYWRIIDEIDRANVSAFVNLSEMLRRGYETDAQRRKRISEAMAELVKGLKGQRMTSAAAAIVASCGPVMRDAKALAEYQAEMERRLAVRKKDTPDETQWKMPEEMKVLLDWNEEMLRAHDSGNLAESARIARKILSRRGWESFVPANAVMGTVMAQEGDYVASEMFYRTAISGREKSPAVVYNDYADTLKHLGRLDEAEKYARLAVSQTDDKGWLFRLTLAEVLRDAGKNPDEVKALVDGVLRHAPAKARVQIRKQFGR